MCYAAGQTVTGITRHSLDLLLAASLSQTPESARLAMHNFTGAFWAYTVYVQIKGEMFY